MSIVFHQENQSFELQSKGSSYIFRITKNKYLEHVYYGDKIIDPVLELLCKSSPRASFSANPDEDTSFSLDQDRVNILLMVIQILECLHIKCY